MSSNKELSFQIFLTLMDNIHDYGNTSRVDKVIKGKNDANEDDESDDEEEDEDIINKKSFSTSFLIDFLMLGYMHDEFRKLIGLSLKKNYIKEKSNCNEYVYVNSSNISKKDPLSKKICERFYFPTYADRIIFRSTNPEKVTKEILFDYLQNDSGKKIYFNEDNIINIDNEIIPSSCINLLLGNKGVDEQLSRLSVNIYRDFNINPSKYKYKQKSRINEIKEEFKVY
jgi:hypothetical protein